MNAILEFKGFKVESVEYNLIDFEKFESAGDQNLLTKLEKNQVNIDISARVLDESHLNIFTIEVNVNTTDKIFDEIRRINFTVSGDFEINSDDLDEESRENLLKINGTAILLPYCRNYLSNLTGFDTTYSQLLMPPFNVTTLFDDQED